VSTISTISPSMDAALFTLLLAVGMRFRIIPSGRQGHNATRPSRLIDSRPTWKVEGYGPTAVSLGDVLLTMIILVFLYLVLSRGRRP
jgi:hypothetical protein